MEMLTFPADHSLDGRTAPQSAVVSEQPQVTPTLFPVIYRPYQKLL